MPLQDNTSDCLHPVTVTPMDLSTDPSDRFVFTASANHAGTTLGAFEVTLIPKIVYSIL